MVDLMFATRDTSRNGDTTLQIIDELNHKWLASDTCPDTVFSLLGLDKTEDEVGKARNEIWIGPRMLEWIRYVHSNNLDYKRQESTLPTLRAK